MKRFGICWVAVVVCGLVWAGLGEGVAAGQGTAEKRPLTFADMMAMKRVSDPQISPSGKWVLFSVTDVSLEKNTKVNHLWVVGLNATAGPSTSLRSAQNDKQKEKQVTFGDGESFGRFSPDGKWVSYSAKDQIHVAAWDEAAGKVGEARQLTSVAGGADGAIWSPDSKRLMSVAAVYPECSVKGGGAPPTSQKRDVGHPDSGGSLDVVVGGTRDVAAWKTAVPAGWVEENACDEARDKAADASPVKGQVWEGLLYRHWDHWTGEKRSHVLVVSAADGSAVRDLTPASAVGDAETPTWFLGGPQEYAWAPDSKEIAYATNLDPVPAASTNNDIYTLRLDEPGAKAVKVSTSPGSDDEPEYSPDGRWLAFRSQARAGFEADKFRLMLFDRSKSAGQQVGESAGGRVSEPAVSGQRSAISELMPKFDNWVDEFVWSPDSARLYFASGHAGAEPIYETDVAGPIAGQVAGIVQSGEFGDIRISPDGKLLVMSGMKVNAPGTVVSMPVDVPVDSLTMLSHVNDQLLDRLDLSPLESFVFTGAEGTKVEGFLLKPPGFEAAKKYPVKFLMHGGPQTAWGDAWSYRWNWELMAANGYVVVGINRRGSTGYGQKFVDEVSGDWGGRAYEDLMKGLDYAEAHYSFIDKTRECALGASYGGYMADWVLTHTNRFKCIVTHDGMYDPVSAYGTTEELWFNEWEFRRPEDFPKGWDGFSAAYGPLGKHASTNAGVPPLRPSASGRDDGSSGGAASGRDYGALGAGHAAEPWRYQNLPADEDPFRRWSPMRFIENAKTPTLVIHSQRDMRLDVSQGFELFTALQRRGVPSKMLYFPDEGHWVLKPQNAELWNAVVGDWCDRWTKSGKYAEAGNREQGTGNR